MAILLERSAWVSLIPRVDCPGYKSLPVVAYEKERTWADRGMTTRLVLRLHAMNLDEDCCQGRIRRTKVP